MVDLPGKELAQELIVKSREEGRSTPMEAVIQAAREGRLSGDQYFRLIGRLWTSKRMFYYVYGNWGLGLQINDFPPSAKYLFAKQILDESTHEMLYMDVMLRKGWITSQREAFRHPYGEFVRDSALASYAFLLNEFATYPHPVRIAGLNLGAKVLEMDWMASLAEVIPDEDLKGVFASQLVEHRSHVNMGQRVVEELVRTPFEAELCRWACRMAKEGYRRFLQDSSRLVLGQEAVAEVEARPVLGVD